MKILLLGINGMLGQSIKRIAVNQDAEVVGIDRSNADYCFDLLNDERLERTIAQERPEVIINTAAIVSLEVCEGNPGNAYCVNARLPGILATLSERYGCYFIQVSTDHYYSGDEDRAHSETDRIKLVNEYARTKYIGELLALSYENALVLRTNIVGFRGRGAPTFLEWAINEIANNHQMTLYTDFYTSSMHTWDFADILMDIIRIHPTGLYNFSSSHVTNKKEFILALSNELFGTMPDYKEGSVKNISGAVRADSLGLKNDKLENLLGRKMPTLKKTIKSIRVEYEERKAKNEI